MPKSTTPPMDQEGSDQPLKRFQKPGALRRGAACEACRKKKIRCDGARPVCRRCLRSYNSSLANPQSGPSIGSLPECHYEDLPAHPHNAHASSSTHHSLPAHAHLPQQPAADTSELESRVRQLESMLKMVAEGNKPSVNVQPIMPVASTSQWRPPNLPMPSGPPNLQQPLQMFPPSVPAPLSVPQSTYDGTTPYAFPWGQPHVSFPHPLFTTGPPPPRQPSPELAPPSWPFPIPAPQPPPQHRQTTDGSPSSFVGHGTPQMSSSSDGTVPTPSSNEGFFPSPANGQQAGGDISLVGSPDQDAALKELLNGKVASADAGEAVVPEAEPNDDEWLLQLLWPNWPAHLPVPGQLQHIVEAFFTHVPFATALLNKPRFLSRLGLPPSHKDFPHPSVLHAICAATSRFIGSLDLLPIAGYAVNPMTCDYPKPANKNEPPTHRRPKWDGRGPRPPADLLNGPVYSPGVDADFGQVHSTWARIYAEGATNHPEYWLEASQAFFILSQYFNQHGIWTNTFAITSQMIRMTGLMQLNSRPFVDRRTYKKGPLVPPATNEVDEAERRNLFWLILATDTFACSQSGWEGVVSADDVWLALPTSPATFSLFSPPPPATQFADTPDLFHFHPASHNTPFSLTMKAVLLLRRCADVVRRADLKGTENPRDTQLFRDLDANLTALIETSSTTLAESPGGFASMHGLAIDPDIVLAQCVPLSASIVLHDRYCDLAEPMDPGLPKLRDATRKMVEQIHQLNRTSFDFGLIHPYIVVAWNSAARTLIRMLQQALDEQQMGNVPALLSSVEIIRLAMQRVGERLPVGQRIGAMTNDMLMSVLRPSGDCNVIIPYK